MSGSERTKGARALRIGLWAVTLVEALMMGVAGSSKLLSGGRARWSEMFMEWGYPGGFSYFVGGVEFLFAVLLLVTALAAWSSIVLLVVMAAALVTVIVTGSALGITGPILHGSLLLFILWGRWPDRLGRK